MNRILIVDDKQDNLYMLRFLLEGHGYKVEEAQHGAEALLKARQSPPQLVISDLLMPVMDGYTLLRHWKSDEQLKQIPFIVYTATYTEPKDEKLALDLGADAFIVKPTEPEPFLNRIQEVLAEQKSGLLSPTKLPICDEQTQIKQYNESLVRKLEEKALQLEQANRALELDIAERKRTEEALHQSTSLLQTAFDATADGILAVDRKGKVIAFNQRFTEMWHIPKSVMDKADDRQLLAQVLEELKDKDGFLAEVEALYNQPEKEGWDIIEFKDGRVFERFSKPQRIGNEIVGRVWDFRDITDHRHTEAEREKLQAQFIQAQKMESVGRLAGGVAHDFNNMLGIIIGYSELALDTAGLPVTLHNHLEEIHNAASRAAEITKKLLAFARKQTISPRVLDLNETVESMLKMLRRLIGEDIDLAWLPGSALWPVMADPSQIDQILANLCVNARDAIAGAGKLTIETDKVNLDDTYCAEHADCIPGDYVMLAVSDDGCGMTTEIIAHLFEPFFTTKEMGKGTGLGLATVYGIVKQNNGFINVYSESGKGTTFKIYLPRHKGESEVTASSDSEQVPRGKGETLLVVEDDAAILELTQTILTGLGYRVLEASTTNTAMKQAEENTGPIHLLITDVIMPEMNGRDLAEKFKALHPEALVLFMSGYTADTIARHGVLEEGIHFLQKPFTIKNIAYKIRQTLDGK